VKPDLVVTHSGFGPSMFLPSLYDAPVINFFEYFYRPVGRDLGYRPELPVTEAMLPRSRTRNAMISLGVDFCDRGWCPNVYQRSLMPADHRGRIEVIGGRGQATVEARPVEAARPAGRPDTAGGCEGGHVRLARVRAEARTSACWSMMSVSRSGRARPFDIVTASRAAASMCSSRSRSDGGRSSRRILHLALALDDGADAVVDEARGLQVDEPAEHFGQLDLHAAEVEEAGGGAVEFDQDVDVAVGREVVAEDGAEEGETRDAVARQKAAIWLGSNWMPW
jgi:hypothetical protein